MSQYPLFWLLLIGYKNNCWYQEVNFYVNSEVGWKTRVGNTSMQHKVYSKIQKMFAYTHSILVYHTSWYPSQDLYQPSPLPYFTDSSVS